MAPDHVLFARYAFPPNELGYCGPADTAPPELASHAKEFDGAWPYLRAIAEAAEIGDPLDEEVVRSYWVGGPQLDRVDPAVLLTELRTSFKGQVTGLLGDLALRKARWRTTVFTSSWSTPGCGSWIATEHGTAGACRIAGSVGEQWNPSRMSRR